MSRRVISSETCGETRVLSWSDMDQRLNEMMDKISAAEVLNVLTMVFNVWAPVTPMPQERWGRGLAYNTSLGWMK